MKFPSRKTFINELIGFLTFEPTNYVIVRDCLVVRCIRRRRRRRSSLSSSSSTKILSYGNDYHNRSLARGKKLKMAKTSRRGANESLVAPLIGTDAPTSGLLRERGFPSSFSASFLFIILMFVASPNEMLVGAVLGATIILIRRNDKER